ncbi:MAG: hypothetical protein JXR63_03800 [Spirochaetales bacterium]|nr:hypothetical protein [Spirochaetales bacterium]
MRKKTIFLILFSLSSLSAFSDFYIGGYVAGTFALQQENYEIKYSPGFDTGLYMGFDFFGKKKAAFSVNIQAGMEYNPQGVSVEAFGGFGFAVLHKDNIIKAHIGAGYTTIFDFFWPLAFINFEYAFAATPKFLISPYIQAKYLPTLETGQIVLGIKLSYMSTSRFTETPIDRKKFYVKEGETNEVKKLF